MTARMAAIIEVVGGHHEHAGVDRPGHGLALQVIDHRLDAQIAHVHRVLHDEPFQLALAERLDERGAVVEAHEADRAGLVDVLQGEEHARGR